MDTAHDLNALFSRTPSGLEYVGPMEKFFVVVHGRQVPFLQAFPSEVGVHINLDQRLGLDLSADEAERVIPFIADCIAVALGYTCHPNPDCPEPTQRPAFPHMERLSP
jgi:hypothetical protein